MRELKRSRMNESDSRYFNGYTDNTVPNVPYGTGGIPQYNPMVVNDRIELMDDVIKKLEDYWYSEDPKLEDEVTRTTKREEVLYIKDIYWELDNPDVVTVKFGLEAFDGSNDRVAETREIEINFENFLGRDIEGDLVIFISKKIKSLLDSVLHGGLYKENKTMRELKRNRKFETVDDSLYDMSGDEYTEDEDYMKYIHPKVVQWFKDFTKSYKLWNGVEKKNIAIIEDIVDSEVVPDDVVDACNDWVESDYFYSLGYLDYDIIDLCKKFLSTYTYPTKENKTIRELKRNRMNESEKLVGDAKLLRSLSEKMDNVRNLLNDDVSKVIIQSLADSVRALSTMNIKGVDSSRYASAEYIFKKDLETSLDSLKKHYQK